MKLPTWEECQAAEIKGNANPLEAFIYHNEPAGTLSEVEHFRTQLKAVMEFAVQEERQKQNDATWVNEMYRDTTIDDGRDGWN